MVYVYYNLRLQVKQIEKVSSSNVISLDDIDTTSKWRVETIEEAPEWLEEEGDDDADPSEEEGEEEEADVPLPEDDYACTMRTLRRRLILIVICSANQLQVAHHLHRVIQLGLGGE